MDPGSGQSAGVRPTHLQHALLGSSPTVSSAVPAASGGVLPGAVKGFPVVSSSHPKVFVISFILTLISLRSDFACYYYLDDSFFWSNQCNLAPNLLTTF